MKRLLLGAALTLVAWGALAFGAVYPWAWEPLIAGAAIVGATAILTTRGSGVVAGDGRLLWALTAVAVAIALQLVPLTPATLATISPGSVSFLLANDLQYSVEPGAHPLSIDPAFTWHALVLLAGFTIFLAGLTRLFGATGVRSAATAIAALGALLAVIGIVQLAVLGQDAFLGMKIYGFWQPNDRLTTPFGPFVNQNHFAGWMLMTLPLVLGGVAGLMDRASSRVRATWRDRVLWLSSRDGGRLQLGVFVSMAMGMSLLLTRSRSGMVACGVALLVGAMAAGKRFATARMRLTAALVVLAAALGAVAWAGTDFSARFSTSAESLNLRRHIWSDARRVIADFPLTGSGLNTFAAAMREYQTVPRPMTVLQAHNDYLQLAAEGGLLAGLPALVALVMLGVLIRRRFAAKADDTMTYWLRVGATTGLFAIGLQSIVEFTLQMPGNAAMFVLIAAIALHPPKPRSRDRHPSGSHRSPA